MSSRQMYAISGAIAAFLTNMMVHLYIEIKALRMVPPDLLVAVSVLPFFPLWIVVVFGLFKLKKWGLQLGLVTSLVAVAFGIAGLLLGWVETLMTLALEFVQIALCAYGLLRMKF